MTQVGGSGSSGGSDTWSEGGSAVEVAPASSEPRYELIEEIGSGAMGRVWRARDRLLDREVAYKELHVQATGPASARFLREARLTARLDHPSIVPVHDAGRDEDGNLFYVMRLLRGRSLHAVLREDPDLRARLRWLDGLISVCQGIAHAHAHGVIHRDLKPANLMIGHYGEVQVVDWGLAKVLVERTAPAGPEDTRGGAVVGTPRYMSPEQVLGDPLTPATDVWSLGIILYELLVGDTPFTHPDPVALLQAITTTDAPDPRTLEPEAPAELAAICRRALRRDPDARYPDAGALLADLESWRSGARVSAYQYSTGEELRRLARRHRVPLVAVSAALAAAALVGLASVGRVVAERDRAREAEITARAAESDANHAREEVARVAQAALTARALGHVDDPITALTLAAEALRLGQEPTARGVVARLLGTQPWRHERTLPAGPGPCVDLVVLGDRFVCAGPEGTWVADADGGLRWHDRSPATRAGLAPDGKRAAFVLESGVLRVVDAGSGATLWERQPKARFLASPAFSPDGEQVALSDERTLVIADAPTGDVRFESPFNSLIGGFAWTGPDALWLYQADGALRNVGRDGTGLRTRLLDNTIRGVFDGAFTEDRAAHVGLSLAGAVTWTPLPEGDRVVLRASGHAGRVGLARGDRAAWAADETGFEAWRVPAGEPLGRLPGLPPRADVWMDEQDRVYLPTAGSLEVYAPHAPRGGSWSRDDAFHLCATPLGGAVDCLVGAGDVVRHASDGTHGVLVASAARAPFRAMASDTAGNLVVSHGLDCEVIPAHGERSRYVHSSSVDLNVDRLRQRIVYWAGSTVSVVPWLAPPGAWTDLGSRVVTAVEVPDGWLVLTRDALVPLDRDGNRRGPPLPPAAWVVADPITGRVATWEGDRVVFREADGAVVGPGYAPGRKAFEIGTFVTPDRFVLLDGADVVVIDLRTGAVWARLVAHPRLSELVALLDPDGRPDGRLATVGYEGTLVFWDLPAAEGTGPEIAARVAAATGWSLRDGVVVPGR